MLINTEDELLDALRSRCDQLRISYESIDRIAGLPDGNAAKCLARPPFKRFSTRSLSWVLAALGYGLELTEDPEALARLQNKFDAKHGRYSTAAAGAPIQQTIRRSFLKKIGRLGGLATKRNRDTIERERRRKSRIYRRNVMKRWRKPKIEEIAPAAPLSAKKVKVEA
jgi:hypothetical protein